MSFQFRAILGLGVIIALLLAYIHYKNVRADRDRYKDERNTARATLQQCIVNQNKNFEVSNDYQQKLTVADRKLADAVRLRNNAKCVPTNTAGGHNATTTTGKLSGRNGISSDYLRDFAYRCEKTRLQLMACQSWVGN